MLLASSSLTFKHSETIFSSFLTFFSFAFLDLLFSVPFSILNDLHCLLSTKASMTFVDFEDDFEEHLFSRGKSTTSMMSYFCSEYSLLVSFVLLKEVRDVLFLNFPKHLKMRQDFLLRDSEALVFAGDFWLRSRSFSRC